MALSALVDGLSHCFMLLSLSTAGMRSWTDEKGFGASVVIIVKHSSVSPIKKPCKFLYWNEINTNIPSLFLTVSISPATVRRLPSLNRKKYLNLFKKTRKTEVMHAKEIRLLGGRTCPLIVAI